MSLATASLKTSFLKALFNVEPRCFLGYVSKYKIARPKRMDTVMRLRIQQFKKEKPKSAVYFLADQKKKKYNAPEVLNALRAFDIWSDESLIMDVKINMGEKKNRLQHLRGTLLLPFPHGKENIVLAFAEGPSAEVAKKFGADIVGGKEVLAQVRSGEINFDHCVCTLDFLPNLKDMQNILRAKMPNIKRGSATDDLKKPIELFKNGISYEADKEGRLTYQVGKLQHPDTNLLGNINAILHDLNQQRTVEEDKYFESISLQGTNSPIFLVDQDSVL